MGMDPGACLDSDGTLVRKRKQTPKERQEGEKQKLEEQQARGVRNGFHAGLFGALPPCRRARGIDVDDLTHG